jgi:hypothetical protein
MWRTIVSQTYLKNVAVDTSPYSNNGIPIEVTPGYQLALRGGTKAGTFQQLAFNRAMMAAIRRRDVDALERVVTGLDPATQAHLGNPFSDAFASYRLRGSD